MKKVFWIIYAVLYIAIALLGAYLMLSAHKFSLVNILSLIFSAIYITGLFAYIFEKKIWEASVWRKFFYLLCFGTSVTLLTGVFSNAGQGLVDSIFGTVISIPLIFALYQYSKGEQNFWLNTEENTKGNIISTLMNSIPVLEIDKQVGEASAKVQITKEGNQYVVDITRVIDNKERTFKNTFTNAGQLALFIEQYTFVKVTDFESKYA